MPLLHFTDTARSAALHILDSPFGERLRQLTTITDDTGCLKISYSPEDAFTLSDGERVLLGLLRSMTWMPGSDFEVCDLSKIDDREWDRVIAALFIFRGRILVAS